MGPGKRRLDGSRQEPRVKVGDVVVLHSYAGNDVRIDGQEYVRLRGSNRRSVGAIDLTPNSRQQLLGP